MNKGKCSVWPAAALVLLLAAGCKQPAGEGPLVADNPVWDYGVVADTTAVLEHTFRLTNTGRDSLTILQMGKSCGCTSLELSDSTLAPGASANLYTELTLGMVADHVDKSIWLSYTGQEKPLVLRLVVDKPRNLADPTRYPYAPDGPARFLVNLFFAGYIAQGEQKEVSLIVYNDSDQPLVLRRQSRLPKYIRLQLPRKVEARSIGRVTATFDMRKAKGLYGEYSHDLLLTDRQGHRIPMQLYCLVTEDFKAATEPAPRLVVPYYQRRLLDEDFTQDQVVKTFRLRNIGDGPLRIRRIQLPAGADVQAQMSPDPLPPGESGELLLTLRGEALKTGVECGVTFNDPLQAYAVFSVQPKGDQ